MTQHDLREALTFRKVIENSVLTGLLPGSGNGGQGFFHSRLPSPYWSPKFSDIYLPAKLCA